RRALRHHEAVAVLREGLRRARRRLVRGGEGGEQREADQRLGVHRAVGADGECDIGLTTLNGLDTKLNGGSARGAGGRERDRRTLGAELFGQTLRRAAIEEALIIGGEALG